MKYIVPVLLAINLIYLGALHQQLQETQKKLSRVDTTASILMAAYQLDRIAKEQREEQMRNGNPITN